MTACLLILPPAQLLTSYEDLGDEDGSEDEYVTESDPSEADEDGDLEEEDEEGNVAPLNEEQLKRQSEEFLKRLSGLTEVDVEQSVLARERKFAKTVVCARVNTNHVKSDPIHITPEQRVREFPMQSFSVHLGKFWCRCCSKELALKKSSILTHIGIRAGSLKPVENYNEVEHVKRFREQRKRRGNTKSSKTSRLPIKS